MSTDSLRKRLTLIELNEFSADLLAQGARELKLAHVSRLLDMKSAKTTTDDMIEHRGLDPWVQWVSVHTGVPSSVHGIIHLGDTPMALSARQLWEDLSEAGISSGIWGAMNATREDAERCHFFLPDPWTFSEPAYPEELNGLLALPRYYSRNYLDVSKRAFLAHTMRLGVFLMGSGAMLTLLRQVPLVLRGVFGSGVNNAMLFSLFDLFSAVLFVKYKQTYQPQFAVIFLNSIAHLQHHRWEKGALSKDAVFALRVIDRVLGMLFASLEPGEAVVVMNALTQRNIVGEKPRICYRQINPRRFLSAIQVRFRSVEQLMTNDAHVFFDSSADCDVAARALEAATLCGKPLFQVERDLRDPLKLFYQVDFWDELSGDVNVPINGVDIDYLDHFEAIVARTGAHIREGDVYYDGIELPARFYNHDMAGVLANYFSVTRTFSPKREPELVPSD